MDQKTNELLVWAKSHTPQNKTFQLNEFTYIEDLEKCIATLAARAEKVSTTKAFIAYRDQLYLLKTTLDKQEN